MQTQPPQFLYKCHMTRNEYVIKVIMGILLFILWVILFVLGMSLEAKNYHDCIISDDAIVDFKYLFWYAISLTPINVAILASVSGALGGIASNLTAYNKSQHLHTRLVLPESKDFQSYLYMTENPFVSLLRGFITYLIFIAGSYLVNFTSTTDQTNLSSFGGLTVSAYFKFAVSVSLLAYLAGYDPSRIKNFLSSVNLNNNDNVNKTEEANYHIKDPENNFSADVTQSIKTTVPATETEMPDQAINGNEVKRSKSTSK